MSHWICKIAGVVLIALATLPLLGAFPIWKINRRLTSAPPARYGTRIAHDSYIQIGGHTFEPWKLIFGLSIAGTLLLTAGVWTSVLSFSAQREVQHAD